MKKFFTRIVTVFLLVAMIVTSISPGAAYAANSFSATDLEAADSTAAGEDTDAVDKEQSGQNTTEQPSTESTEQKEDADKNKTAAKENSSKDTEADTDQQEKNTISKDSKKADAAKADAAKADAENINFVYVESPYLETPGTQRIVFYFEEAISGAEVSALIVKDESGKETKWALAKQKDGLYLFEKTFNDKDASGTYQAVRLELTADGKSQVISLSDLGVEAEFGVNEEYDGLEELQPINEEEAGNLGASVVTIDENGTTQAQTSIANALNSVSAKTRSAKTARAGDIIVALDPGHDSKSTGASANGLKEEVLTLKIANYCKEELEKYDGVKVYMTRTTAACPFNMSGSGCIQKRVNAAADAGAQIFVSFHLNSATSTSAKGAEIIIPNKNWRPAVAAEGEELAEAILDELVKVGVTKRATPIYSKSASSDKYSNGTAADYFAVQRYSKLRNIPGIIIEHGFITNTSDVNNFLKTESGLKKLGVADATGIAKYLGLSQGQWKTDSKGNKYYYENGKKVTGEKYISGYWYYFDQNGVMKTGWHSFSNKKVYYDSNGRMVKGEKKISGYWYLFKESTGAMVTGWYSFSNKKVYYDSNGRMVKGEKQISEKWYLFDERTGGMVTGWYSFSNKKVYYDSNGQMVKGEKQISNHWYLFKETTGAMVTGWYSFPNKKVYYDSNGRMVKGEKQISGYWYLFKESTGGMVTGWYSFSNKKVYYDSNGRMIKGEKNISGKWYLFDNWTGGMVTGWYDFSNKRVYYDVNGAMIKGEKTISGKTYYFDQTTGAMAKNKFVGNKYYGSDGVLVPESKYSSVFYKIEGNTTTNIDQMVRFYEENSPIAYPSKSLKPGGAATIKDFATIYYEEAKKEGIKAEVAWAQTMHETGWLKFGGQVKISQYNFAGLGATDGGASGAKFKDVRTGVRAQIQHLKAYASTGKLNQTCVDPRFNYVKRGCAQYVEILGQKENPNGYGWATSEKYGVTVSNLIKELKKA